MINSVDVVGLGNALLDFQTEVPFEFLKSQNLTAGSMTLVDLESQKQLLDKLQQTSNPHGIKMSSGGCSANTLAGLTNYGGTGLFIGKVSEDTYGRHYASDLKNIGIVPKLSFVSHGQTGSCVALITPDAERTMLTHLGVAVELSEDDIQSEWIQNSKILYIEGYLWDSDSARKACLKSMKIAKDSGKKVAFTYSDSFCVSRHHHDFVELAKTKVDILFCNEAEAIEATKTKNVDEAFSILKTWCDIVCITTGPRGALLSHRSQKIERKIPTWQADLVDKLGAGDLFASGVLYGLTSGHNIIESGYLGCYAATRVIQQMSARLDISLAKDISKILRGPSASEIAA